MLDDPLLVPSSLSSSTSTISLDNSIESKSNHGNRSAISKQQQQQADHDHHVALKIIEYQLSYIGKECERIPQILGQTYGDFTKRLDLSYNQLSTLDNIDLFICLEELILDNNELGDEVQFVRLASLHTLSLNKNRFKDLDRLLNQLMKCYPNLKYLSLLGNPACPTPLSIVDSDDEDYRRYRYYVVSKLPQLKFLDSARITKQERLEAVRRGCFMRVVKPTQDVIIQPLGKEDESTELGFTPLPIESSSESQGVHRGAYGRLRYRYTGKHSEGNRFIRNNEL